MEIQVLERVLSWCSILQTRAFPSKVPWYAHKIGNFSQFLYNKESWEIAKDSMEEYGLLIVSLHTLPKSVLYVKFSYA